MADRSPDWAELLARSFSGPPDRISVQVQDGWHPATQHGDGWWSHGVGITTSGGSSGTDVAVTSEVPVLRVWLRWSVTVPTGTRVLGDHWERSYGDLEWRDPATDRPLPWYAVLTRGGRSVGVGVRTGPAAWCAWSVDDDGVGLLLDIRSGARGVELQGRTLMAATVVSSTGAEPFATTRELCRRMCPSPVLPDGPVYGGNNWYHAYGVSSATEILAEAQLLSELAGDAAVRPFMVVDDGWQPAASPSYNGGPWRAGNARFPDPAAVATGIRRGGARPGIWFRPLLTRGERSPWRTVDQGEILDPSRQETLERVSGDVAGLVEWGYELVKHDFSTVDITGRWGHRMGWDPVEPGLRFADGARTTVEVIRELYRVIAAAAGDALVLGCNTIGHLAAGVFALQRTGDDTSGVDFARTRTMGVNTLAFRTPQHGTFFAVDADCVGITAAIDWDDNAAWLDLLARSGTPLFVSVAPATVTERMRADLRAAFATASRPRPVAVADDWLQHRVPAVWQTADGERAYRWNRGDARPLIE